MFILLIILPYKKPWMFLIRNFHGYIEYNLKHTYTEKYKLIPLK